MIEIRQAKSEDIKQIKQLWSDSFGQDEPYFSWYFHNIYQNERTFCLFYDGTLVSSLQYAPKTLCLHEMPIAVAYLVGVCTDKKYRHRGYARLLLQHTIAKLSQHYTFLMLYTDIPDFYRPFGFTHCYQLRRYTLPATPGIKPDGWYNSPITTGAITQANAIYQHMTAKTDGYIIRSNAMCRDFFVDFLSDGGGLYLKNNACLLWIVDNENCKIKEVGYTDAGDLAEALALAQIIAHANGFSSVIWDAPINVVLPHADSIIIPHVMALDTTVNGSPRYIAKQTRLRFGPVNKLWVNEIT